MRNVFEKIVFHSGKGKGYEEKRRNSPKMLWARTRNSSLCSPKNVLWLYVALNRFYFDGRLTMHKKAKEKMGKKRRKKSGAFHFSMRVRSLRRRRRPLIARPTKRILDRNTHLLHPFCFPSFSHPELCSLVIIILLCSVSFQSVHVPLCVVIIHVYVQTRVASAIRVRCVQFSGQIDPTQERNVPGHLVFPCKRKRWRWMETTLSLLFLFDCFIIIVSCWKRIIPFFSVRGTFSKVRKRVRQALTWAFTYDISSP